ncbi:MAG TPA: alpha/beta hydrolase [Novosphingobium sp.]|nr:alpha/beta hydrolase [Novosphingobium sp.]
MLLVPGHDDAPARRWLANWESRFPEAITVELGLWDRPHRNTWVNRLNLAIHRAGRPVVIVAEGLATMAVAWWAEYEQPGAGGPVRGALLIDPPDVDRPGGDARLASFPSCPRAALPFAACVLASRSRGPLALRTIRQLAADWGGPFDTLASAAVLAAPSLSPVQSLGQKVLSGWMSATA